MEIIAERQEDGTYIIRVDEYQLQTMESSLISANRTRDSSLKAVNKRRGNVKISNILIPRLHIVRTGQSYCPGLNLNIIQ